MMVVPNLASWNQAIDVHLKHHTFPIFNTLNAIRQSIDFRFENPNFLLKVFSDFFAYNGLDFSFKTCSIVLHTKSWETVLIVVVLF